MPKRSFNRRPRKDAGFSQSTVNLQRPRTSREAVLAFIEIWRSTERLVRDQWQDWKYQEIEVDHQATVWAERLLQRQRTIDHVLKSRVSRPREQVEFRLWNLLQCGANELLFGPKESQHAAISETVELCRNLGHANWTGFLNGVLRSVQRLMTETESDQPARTSYPVGPNQYRVLNEDVFPDPVRNQADYLGTAFSLPDSLVQEWKRRYSPEELWQLAWSTISSPPLTVRINRMVMMPEEWIEQCKAAEIEVEQAQTAESIRILSKVRLSEMPGFAAGAFVIQDETASHAAKMLNPYPKDRVLDLCAGPGTKTTQLAELMLDQGELVATEIAPIRIDQIAENAERLGFTCIKPELIFKGQKVLAGEPFDAILIDAPCSNTGVLGKRPEARWRYSQKSIHELNDMQMELLDLATAHLSDTGRMVYSTCSIEPKENEQLVSRWLENHPEFRLTDQKGILPTPSYDGGYCARLERIEPEVDGESDVENQA